jgi:hypothetical protein
MMAITIYSKTTNHGFKKPIPKIFTGVLLPLAVLLLKMNAHSLHHVLNSQFQPSSYTCVGFIAEKMWYHKPDYYILQCYSMLIPISPLMTYCCVFRD